MKLLLIQLVIFQGLMRLLPGQQLELVPTSELKARSEAMGKAQAAMQTAAQGIEANLKKRPADESVKQITLAKEKTRSYVEARDRYYSAMEKSLTGDRQRFAKALAHGAGFSYENAKALSLKALDELRRQSEMLEKVNLDKAAKDQREWLVLQEAKKELAALNDLEGEIGKQAKYLSEMASLDSELNQKGYAMLDTLDSLIGRFRGLRSDLLGDGQILEDYYDSLIALLTKPSEGPEEHKAGGSGKQPVPADAAPPKKTEPAPKAGYKNPKS